MPLAEIRVLELGQVIAGTFGGMIMADLGAEVIKVESPKGDLGRNPEIARIDGESALFLTMNRGKKSVVIDLKKEAGRDTFYELVRHSDVVVNNFRPGVVERLGIEHATLQRVNPRIVSCAITGFGSRGVSSDAPSFDLIHQAVSGHLSITGEPGGPPIRVGIPLADLGAALFAVQAILSALIERSRTGLGQQVELSLLEVMTFLLTYDATVYLNTGHIPGAYGTGHAYHVPWQAFRTEDGWLVVATREEIFWQKFCEAIDLRELSEDPRFATNLARLESRATLVPILEARLRERPNAEWLAAFEAHGVPAAPVNDVAQALEHPTLAENRAIVDVPYSPLGQVRMLANPMRFARLPSPTYGAPPFLGEHTRDVLTDLCGYKEERLRELEGMGAILSGHVGSA